MRHAIFLPLLLVLGTILAGPIDSAELPRGRWHEVRTPNFTLVGDASEETLVAVAQDLERLRAALAQISRLRLQAADPTLIYVFKSARKMRPYLARTPSGEIQAVDGAFFRNPHGNFILVNGERPDRARRLIYHEYVHFFVSYNFPPVPLWFEEGLAELYSTFAVQGQHALLGKVIPEHLAWLRANSWIPLRELVTVHRESSIYNENFRKGAFYAQSWLLVHYLFHGHGDGSSVLRKLLSGLQRTDRDRAFQAALGATYPKIEQLLRRYAQRKVHLSQKLPIEEIAPAALSIRRLSKPEVFVLVGDLLAVQSGRRGEAEALFRAALDRNPKSPVAWRGLGLSAETAEDFLSALASYDRSLALAPEDPMTRALSLRVRLRSGEDPRLVRAGLRRLVGQAPDFPLAWQLLASTFVDPSISERDAHQAVPIFERAHELSPENLALAQSLWHLYARLNRGIAARRLEAQYFRPRGIDPRGRRSHAESTP